MLENNYFNLFLGVPDTDFAKIIEEVNKTLEKHPEIRDKADFDLDKAALEKKRIRYLNKQYKNRNTLCFNNEMDKRSAIEYVPDKLETGCPRISSEEVILFNALEGYWGSVTDKRAIEAMNESVSLYIYYSNLNKNMPKPKTIHENLRYLSIETLDYILECQLKDFLNEGLDNFSYLIMDSTSVHASSSWPTDATIICKLLNRIYKQSQKLSKFEIEDIKPWCIPDWLKKLKELLFEINNTRGSKNNPKAIKIKKPYRQFLNAAHNMNQYIIREFEKRVSAVAKIDINPVKMLQFKVLWNNIEDDILAVSSVLYYAEERVFYDVKLPSTEKILSISDTTAAFIKKGQRNPVIGYKPQIGMSSNGFVTALILDKGNVADSDYLFQLTEKHKENTGITPSFISADDGYSSKKGRNKCLEFGVENVCLSGAVGKGIIGNELWGTEEYIDGRKKRSAVESLMFTLKYVFQFGRMRRVGIEAVRKEMLTKIIAYNYRHKILKLKRIQAEREEKLLNAG